MKSGKDFFPIKANGDMIIDRDLRYLASLLAEIERIPCPGTSATTVIDWNEVDVDQKQMKREGKDKPVENTLTVLKHE